MFNNIFDFFDFGKWKNEPQPEEDHNHTHYRNVSSYDDNVMLTPPSSAPTKRVTFREFKVEPRRLFQPVMVTQKRKRPNNVSKWKLCHSSPCSTIDGNWYAPVRIGQDGRVAPYDYFVHGMRVNTSHHLEFLVSILPKGPQSWVEEERKNSMITREFKRQGVLVRMTDLKRGRICGIQLPSNIGGDRKYLIEESGKKVWQGESRINIDSIKAYKLRLMQERSFWVGQIAENIEDNSDCSDIEVLSDDNGSIELEVKPSNSRKSQPILIDDDDVLPEISFRRQPDNSESERIKANPKRSRPGDIYDWAKNMSKAIFLNIRTNKSYLDDDTSPDDLPIRIVDKESD